MPGSGQAVVGTVVGISSTSEFQMQVKPNAVRAQDLVAVDAPEDGCTFRVWAKVTSIERLNPLFPREAAQELAFQGRDPMDSVISMSREMITATCRIIGVQHDGRLEPPKYPVQPAGRVYVPPAAEIESFLDGEVPEHRKLYLGKERGNSDVDVFVDGHMIVSRHLAVLASTGAGKTVAVRRLLEGLMDKGYPILIFDPHGDYAGLSEAGTSAQVTTYLPQISLTKDDSGQALAYIHGLSGETISPPQESLIAAILEVLTFSGRRDAFSTALQKEDLPPLQKNIEHDNFYAMAEIADRITTLKAGDDRKPLPPAIASLSGALNVQSSTANAVCRQCKKAGWQYWNMLKTNRKYSGAAESLPSGAQLASIIKRGSVAIISLEGYSDELRQSIVAGVMQQLMNFRIDDKVQRFLTVIEEAHNFIPNRIDGSDAPSLPIIKQIATEGRKYGMGLVFISQRPSRIDATVLSQANSYLIMRIVNPNDQRYIRDVVESLGEDEARALQNLNTGEALLSGLFTRIPVMVKVEKSKSEGKHEEQDFLGYLLEERSGELAAEEPVGWKMAEDHLAPSGRDFG